MPLPPDTSAGHDDRLTRFLLPEAGVRGAHIRLGPAWREAIARSDDPGPLRDLLGHAIAATALLSAHAKVDGRLSLQLRAPGALRGLFAECTAAGTVRGLARPAEDATPEQTAEVARDLRRSGDGALMAITIENPTLDGNPMRYQGLVPLDSPDLAGALEHYFRQSEQLPTRLLLAADDRHASGLLLQKLPGDEADADGWNRIEQLFATLGGDELQTLDAHTLLHRLFHQEVCQWLSERSLAFGCSCSRARVEDVLRTLGIDEARSAVEAGHAGRAEVRCEFCGQRHFFNADEIEALFAAPSANSEPPARLQ
ncbi:Hsp33 family molecular chaperone HslO [Lysobacter pythonis]|uniref:Hsp33 family molecular chaperone HslO n=1 Tax=Solilutibacter pythonis TaxID=2483112 RepID=A0A3M2HM13_9GAMM|nr:Hsp33 family molecular chaperone HslO [Lysobacter pythonis]RMH88610.1 Hsp33 family molecular chaperone HslO [Lysobacter pythonis]